MTKWVNLAGPILANTVYIENKLVAKDVSFTLPAITPITAEFQAMGTVNIPIPGMFEDMEYSITKVGVDQGLIAMLRMHSQTVEFRWAQTEMENGAAMKTVGCKAFIRGFPKGIPGITINPGDKSENEVAGSATRYQLFVDGAEQLLFDRLAGICRIGGVDYGQTIANLL